MKKELFGLLVICGLIASCADHDRVLFNNANSSGEIGILLDGTKDGSFVNDANFTTTATGHIDPGVMTSGANNEVIAFQQQRPPFLASGVNWTTGNEDVTVNFAPQMGVTFYVWLVQGSFADRQAQAVAACIRLDQIWRDERMGAHITGFNITDATTDPDRNQFLDFTCAEASDMRNLIGFNSNGVNIYYVNRVDFGSGFATTNGVWCGSNTVVMGSGASDHLAAHEIGHAFALDHVNALTTNFDQTNVMHNASNTRRFLTEGQTFRSNLNSSSVINSTYNLRPGLPTRNCPALSETATNTCPAIQKRIWADGTFPSN